MDVYMYLRCQLNFEEHPKIVINNVHLYSNYCRLSIQSFITGVGSFKIMKAIYNKMCFLGY